MAVVVEAGDHVGEEQFEAYRRAVSETFVPLLAEPTLPVASFACRLDSSDVGLIQISDVEATPHVVRRIESGGAGFLKLGLQVSGTATLHQDGRTARLTPGDFALYDTVRPYELEFHDDYRMLVLMFGRSLLRLPTARVEEVTARAFRGSGGPGALLVPLVAGLNQLCLDDNLTAGGPLSDAVLSLVAAGLSAESAYEPRTASRLAILRESAKAYVDHHLADLRLDATSVAGAHHVSVRQLQKAFADQPESVAGYIRAQRLERCVAELADPSDHRPVSAIGAHWGFPDPGHFSRVFRRRFGVPPGEYRSRHHP